MQNTNISAKLRNALEVLAQDTAVKNPIFAAGAIAAAEGEIGKEDKSQLERRYNGADVAGMTGIYNSRKKEIEQALREDLAAAGLSANTVDAIAGLVNQMGHTGYGKTPETRMRARA